MKLKLSTIIAFVIAIITPMTLLNAKTTTDEGVAKAKSEATPEQAVKDLKPGAGIYAVIDTSVGRIICKMFPDKAPIGVENFVGLAEGTKEFIDPKTHQKTKRRFYDGLIFHRIIPDFMIQGGDPLGTGSGGPGYMFKNEISRDLKFDRPGRLAYANAGADTNGSQFFITHKATPWLDGGYTIFGQTINGQEIVNAMGSVKRAGERPIEPIYIKKITIVRIEDGKKKGN
jgi:peptidyl-prolyl cis-trans isomerase A (cyclophilin A)